MNDDEFKNIKKDLMTLVFEKLEVMTKEVSKIYPYRECASMFIHSIISIGIYNLLDITKDAQETKEIVMEILDYAEKLRRYHEGI